MIHNPIPWPNGARCAACVTFDMDADSLVHIGHPTDGHSRVSAISMLQYGPKVAVPRIVDSYAALGIKQTFFIPAWCIETYPVARRKRPQALFTILYCSTDCLSRRGAAVKNLSHSASFHPL